MADTVNKALADFLLKHQHYIERFANGTVNELIDIYSTAKPQIQRMIRDLEEFGTGYSLDVRLERLRSRLREINVVLKYADDSAVSNLTDKLSQFAKVEKVVVEGALGSVVSQIGIDFARIPLEQIDFMIQMPLGGATYAERFARRYEETAFAIKQDLTQSLLHGEGMAKAAKRLFGTGERLGGDIGNRIMDQSSTIARTEIMRVSNGVHQALYDSNRDILKGLVHSSTLDPDTCLTCGALDGFEYIYGVNDPLEENIPPLHPRCHCGLLPILKSWEELDESGKLPPPTPGIRVGQRHFVYTGVEPPKGFGDVRKYKNQDKWAGDVPTTTNYSDWLGRMDKSDPAFVKDILGPSRYSLWKDGDLELKQMVSGNKVIPLRDL